jgi:2-keto-4-pentenoate hydratase/2-oxohepta-3-ene-1,7-dioic acid hydratase in catechol pathway
MVFPIRDKPGKKMKLISFERNKQQGFGAVIGDQVIDLTGQIQGASCLRELLENGALDEVAAAVDDAPLSFSLDDCIRLPVIPNPRKIVCVGLNYIDHVKETGRELKDNPVIFHRYPETQTGHGQAIQRPKVSDNLDFEGEMAVIFGKGGAHIDPADAMDHIAGYACYNEGTIRDWQAHTRQFGMGKNFQKTGAFGPWMVTADEIPDYRQLNLQTRLNGEIMQDASLADLAFDIPTLISYVSKALPWLPGDVLVTGTPGGVGFKRTPPVFMKPGDTVEIEVSGIGTLVNPIEDEK